MDSVYPEPLSRLYRRIVRKKVHKNNTNRYKTQPVTFAEIQEVDEESVAEEPSNKTAGAASKSELDLKAKFEEFKRQRDKDLWDSRLPSKTMDYLQSPDNYETNNNSDKDKNSDNNSGTRIASPQVPIPTVVVSFRDNASCQRPSI